MLSLDHAPEPPPTKEGFYVIFWGIGTLVLLIIGLSKLVGALEGRHDRWFEKNTDPILKGICDFVNRKNGGCDDD